MSEYTERVARNLEEITGISTGGCPGCATCEAVRTPEMSEEEFLDLATEPSYSWSSCDWCHSPLGGDRHPAHGILDGEILHFEICTDCLFYDAYGTEPAEDG